ncbi:hypothetical protein [Leifsonia aquatica]|uniref:hypothetical protein n=1 Tax=Leifsonia aquatica TaxID=144185 RepID=UPI00046ABF20|nr:hypothetical protein [Leifsonia aquatica]
MHPDLIEYEGGDILANLEDRTITGLLVPFNELGQTNAGRFMVEAGAIALPSDPSVIGLNTDHDRSQPVGRATRVWQEERGIFASFRMAETPEGDAALADATNPNGKRRRLSGEFHTSIKAGKAVPGTGRLWGGALVPMGAFPSAMVLAADSTQTSDHYEHEFTDENGVTWRRVEDSTTEVSPDGNTTTTETTVTTTIEDQPADPADPAEPDDQEEELIVTATKAGFAGAPTGAKPAAEPAVDLREVFASIATVKAAKGQTGDPLITDAIAVLAALSDITVEKAGGLTGANSGILQPAWVGKLWQGRRYQRKYLDLLTHLYGGIQLGGRKGFKIDQGTALVTKWAGNKSDIGSGTATTSLTSSTRQAYGFAADIAREWYDLEGGAEVLQAFFEGLVDSYAKVTDEDGLRALFLVASKNAAALDRLIAPDTFPSVDGHDYEGAMGQVIQGIEAVYDADDTASFSVVNPTAWRQLLYTPKDLVPEYVQFGIGAGTGEAAADGKVKIVKAADSFFPGLDPAKPQTIVGAQGAIEFREQGETPIQIDALDIAKGGVDKAVIGYLETFVVRPESVVLIGTKSA